jgi:hypothetical protein
MLDDADDDRDMIMTCAPEIGTIDGAIEWNEFFFENKNEAFI